MTDGAERRSPGFLLILVATALVGVAGYVITWLVPRTIGVGPYAVFAVFWSALFLVVAALSGIQQETTRATVPRGDGASGARAMVFAVAAAATTAAALLATSPLWVGAVFDGRFSLVWPLVVGCSSYVLLAVLAGTLYAASRWRLIFALMTIEGVGRLVVVGLALLISHDPVLLAWAAALPIPLAVALVAVAARPSIAGRFGVDVGYRSFTWNAARTIVAAASMGLLVSGFPLLLAITSPDAPATQLGLLILIATLTRSPLIVVAMALQSYLIVHFRRVSDVRRSVLTLLALALVVGAVLGVLGLLVGPAVFAFLFPAQPVPPGWLIAVMVATSALVAGICVTAPAVLAAGRHAIFTAGWVTAAAGTALALLVPAPLYERASIAVLVGPALGLAIHLASLLGRRAPQLTKTQGDTGANPLRP